MSARWTLAQGAAAEPPRSTCRALSRHDQPACDNGEWSDLLPPHAVYNRYTPRQWLRVEGRLLAANLTEVAEFAVAGAKDGAALDENRPFKLPPRETLQLWAWATLHVPGRNASTCGYWRSLTARVRGRHDRRRDNMATPRR